MAVAWKTPIEVTHATNAAWTDVDVSAYVPAGATGVILHLQNELVRDIGIRKNGSTDNRITELSSDFHLWAAVGVDANRIFELYVETPADWNVYLVGYFTDDAVFLTNGTNKSIVTDNAWTDIDISSDTSTDTAIGAILEIQELGAGDGSSYRKNGSTDNRVANSPADHKWCVIGVDGSEILEANANDASDTNIFLTGYIKSHAVFSTNAADHSTATTGSYVNLTTLASGATGAIYEVYSTASIAKAYALRKDGSSEDVYKDISEHSFTAMVQAENGIVEGKIEEATVDFFLTGYFYSSDSPILTNLYLHLDATKEVYSDAGVTPIADGTAAYQWNDISGKNLHASQATSANRPIYRTTGINSIASIDFVPGGAGNDYMATPNTTWGAFTQFVVFKLSGTAGMILERGSGAAGDYIYGTTGNTTKVARTDTSAKELTSNWSTDDAAKLVSKVFNGTHASHKLWINTVEQSLTGSGSDPGTGDYTNTLNIGGRTTSLPIDGYIGEIIVFNAALSDADRQSVEDYLTNKWGISSGTDYEQNPADNVSVADVRVFSVGKNISESISVTETRVKAVGKTLADAPTVADAISKAAGKVLADAPTVTDAETEAVGKGLSETVSVTDAFSRVATFERTLTETVNVSDVLANALGKLLADDVTVEDVAGIGSGKALADDATVDDAFVLAPGKGLNETVTITEARTFDTGKALADSVTVADVAGKSVGTPLTDDVEVSDAATTSTGKGLSDTVSVADARAIDTGKALSNSVTVSDAAANSTGKTLADTVEVADETTAVTSIGQNVDDGVSVTDAESAAVGKNMADSISVADAESNASGKNLTESIEVSDANVQSASTALSDSISAADATQKAVGVAKSENVSVSDASAQTVGKALADDVDVSDSAATVNAVNQQLDDDVSVSDTASKAVGKSVTDSATVSDTITNGLSKLLSDGLTVADAIVRGIGKAIADIIRVADELSAVLGLGRLHKLRAILQAERTSVDMQSSSNVATLKAQSGNKTIGARRTAAQVQSEEPSRSLQTPNG